MKNYYKNTVMMMICFFIGYSAFADNKSITDTIDLFTSYLFEEVSGPQSGVWPSGNIYHVIGNISVSNGDTLIIEPGVTVKFMDYYSFNISGALIAVGNENDSIYFTSNLAVGSAGDWFGMIFDESSNDNSIISYSRIEFALFGILNNSSPSINNSTITKNYYGIFCESNMFPIISNNIFSFNQTGIFCRYGSSPTISNNTVTENSVAGITCESSFAVIDNNNIINNVAIGINCNNSDTATISGNNIIINNIISDNHLDGVYCHNVSTTTISDNTIMYNGDLGWSGGISCVNSSPIISDNIIRNNRWIGIECDNSSPTIIYNTIRNDSTGIWCENSSPTIRNNTISNNSYSGIYCWGSSPAILNNILYNNTGQGGIVANSVPSSLEYNLFWENIPTASGNSLPAAFGEIVTLNANGDSCDTYYNLFLEPLFVDPANYDFHLTENSPCIDAGNPDPAYYDPDGTVADIGAFYYDQGSVGINEITNHNINIYPNPSEGIFNIYIEGLNGKILMKLFDVNGNDHRFFEIDGTKSIIKEQLDLTELPAGVYFMRFYSKGFSQVKKIVIQ